MSGLDFNARSTSAVDTVFDKAAQPATEPHREFFDVIRNPFRSLDDVAYAANKHLADQGVPGYERYKSKKTDQATSVSENPSARDPWMSQVRSVGSDMDAVFTSVNRRLAAEDHPGFEKYKSKTPVTAPTVIDENAPEI